MPVVKHEFEVMIPEDHQLRLDVPETVRSGPAKLILLITSEETPAESEAKGADQRPKAVERWDALRDQIALDGRPFGELSTGERRERLALLRGARIGLSGSSEALAQEKQAELELEERKFGR